MARALFLAERGLGTTTPNPVVGAVVLDTHGVIVGQGAHRVAGGPHAEVYALDAAGDAARGGTLYCTLEPCCHTGRTGPCTDRILRAGIRRVVIAHEDPNPRVAGGGIAVLEAHGIEVERGVLRDVASWQNAPFFTWVQHGRPHVTLKIAVSREGAVGRADARVMLSGPDTNRAMHRQRAAVDAIAVGANTVLIDDPLLTVRESYRVRPLVRVILDRRERVPMAARVFGTLAAGPVIMVVGDPASAHARALVDAGVTVWPWEEPTGISGLLARLGQEGIVRLLLEGGPTVQRAFWDAGMIDRVQVIETSVSLPDGVSGFVPPRPELVRTQAFRSDRLVEWDVHRLG